ncbi:hypothetical protein ACFVH6_29585 [Spirillospora sp. NPDC127200]
MPGRWWPRGVHVNVHDSRTSPVTGACPAAVNGGRGRTDGFTSQVKRPPCGTVII